MAIVALTYGCQRRRLTLPSQDHTTAIRTQCWITPRLINGRGVAYATIKTNIDRAIADFVNAGEVKSDYPDAYCNRGGGLRS